MGSTLSAEANGSSLSSRPSLLNFRMVEHRIPMTSALELNYLRCNFPQISYLVLYQYVLALTVDSGLSVVLERKTSGKAMSARKEIQKRVVYRWEDGSAMQA